MHPCSGGIPTYADSDSGISDTDVVASGSDAGDEDSDNDRKEDEEAAESPEPMEEEEEQEAFEVVLAEEEPAEIPNGGAGNSVAADNVDMGDELLLAADPTVVEDQLFHIDDQLITIDENLEEITDEFLHLDEQGDT